MRILIETISADQMRYDTGGDWFIDAEGALRIQVVAELSPADQRLVAVHALVEALLCERRGITADQVDEFDFAWGGDGEPGDDPEAPYRREHRFACLLEHMLAHELGEVGYGVVA